MTLFVPKEGSSGYRFIPVKNDADDNEAIELNGLTHFLEHTRAFLVVKDCIFRDTKVLVK